ncbi:hypothetical protein H5T51_06140 [Candidatus Bathyarchaeota archaeon]|nr:hypothetical protein [Candidatus Bathyarchaeota archaeon]
MKRRREEISRRLPKLTMNLIMAFIFWVISIFVPPTAEGIVLPGFGYDASTLIWFITIVIMGIFLVRALSDALVIGDILTDAVVRRMGVKEDMSPKRAARDLAYIIVILLAVTAISPLVSMVENIGGWLNIAATYIALALILILIYDMGRILYKIIESRAESLAERLTKAIEEADKES